MSEPEQLQLAMHLVEDLPLAQLAVVMKAAEFRIRIEGLMSEVS